MDAMPTPQEAIICQQLRSMFDTAVAAADPRAVLATYLPEPPKGRCIVVGAGKASAAMAAALEQAWPHVPMQGVVVTRYGHGVPTQHIRVVEASHPVPDAAGMQAAEDILAAVQHLTADDLVIALISGGGSALLTLPAEGITLADKQAVNAGLLASGAPIHAMNTVRKALSRIKGGKLAQAAAPARVVTLVISDVPGDDPAIIASGPTVPSTTTAADALQFLQQYNVDTPYHVVRYLESQTAQTPQSFPVDVRMIASPMQALQAVADKARSFGWNPILLGDALEGESSQLGTVLAGIAASVRAHGHPVSAPALLLSGGETTVTIGRETPGRGGRNTEFLLSLAIALKGAEGIYAIAGDTDGIDGSDDAAGAIVTPTTLARAAQQQMDAKAYLRGHDSYTLFGALQDLVFTGPTLTNVNDVRAILIC
jgi:hydroxypyruvate reductase